MNLDQPTLFIIFILVDVLMLSMFAFAASGRASTSNRYWSFGLLLHLLAMILIALRGQRRARVQHLIQDQNAAVGAAQFGVGDRRAVGTQTAHAIEQNLGAATGHDRAAAIGDLVGANVSVDHMIEQQLL